MSKSNDLQLEYDQPVNLRPGYAAENKNTNDGSPSEVTVKNLSSANKVSITITLGQVSERYEIFPKETIKYPKDGAKNFEGLVLRVSNTNPSSNDATAEVRLTSN